MWRIELSVLMSMVGFCSIGIHWHYIRRMRPQRRREVTVGGNEVVNDVIGKLTAPVIIRYVKQ